MVIFSLVQLLLKKPEISWEVASRRSRPEDACGNAATDVLAARANAAAKDVNFIP